MKYNIVIIISFTTFLIFLLHSICIPQQETKDDFKGKYKISESNRKILVDGENNKLEWLFETRLENYYKNLDSLKGALLNIVIIVALGLLLIVYKTKSIPISFLSISIPQGLLYILVIFGTLYSWSNFGLELNSAIDSRLALKENLVLIIGKNQYEQLKYDQRPEHILVDNAIVDSWCSTFFNYFDDAIEDNSEKKGDYPCSSLFSYFQSDGNNNSNLNRAYSYLTLFGLYGTLFGVIFAISLIAPIEFGKNIPVHKFYSIALLSLSIALILVPNIFWVFELHKYSSPIMAYSWFISGMIILVWKLKGDKISKKLKFQPTDSSK